MRIIINDVTKLLFKKIFIEELNEFQPHAHRVKNQLGRLWFWKLFGVVHTYLFKWTSPRITNALMKYSFTLKIIHPTAIYSKQNNYLVQQGGRFCRLYFWYQQKKCLGKLQEIDHDYEKVLISFMSHEMSLNPKIQFFLWPIRADELWFIRNPIFINIALPDGKKRGFRISV